MKKLTALFICLLAMLFLVSCNITVTSNEENSQDCASLGHDYAKTSVEQEPTCTTEGVMVSTCIRCGDSKTEAIPAAGHVEITESAVAATCTEDGKTEKKYCEICETVTLESQVIPAAHVIDKQIENAGWAATQTQKGAAFFSCTNCEEEIRIDLPVLGDPSYKIETVGDSQKYTCEVDGKTAVFYVSLFTFAEKDGMNYYVIMGYNGSSTSLTLPSTHNNKPVREIAQSAFAGNTTLTSVTIPEGYNMIGSGAFKDCSALKEVTISEGIYKIEDSAFANCTALLSVSIPASTEIIEGYAFSGCTKLASVSSATGSKMKEIYSYAFSNCTSLKTFSLGGDPSMGILYGCNAIEELTVKTVSVGGISGVGRLFSLVTSLNVENSIVPASLKTVTLTGYVTVTDTAFRDCKNIEKIVVKNCEAVGRTTDYYPCFKGCDALKELHIGRVDQIVRISNCPSLQVISIDYVGTIESNAFSGITPPTTISITSVGTAKAGAFSGCTAITQESIGSIGQIQGEPYSNIEGTYAYTDTQISVTDTFWYMLVQVKENGMLEYMFGDLPYGDEIIDAIERSNSKAEYEVNAAKFSRMTGENLTVTFTPGPDGEIGVMEISGGAYQGTCSYIESSGQIYLVANNRYFLFFTIDIDSDTIFEYHTTEDGTWVKHIYEKQ